MIFIKHGDVAIPVAALMILFIVYYCRFPDSKLSKMFSGSIPIVLDTLKHLDIHSNTIQYNSVLSRVACLLT